MYYSLFDDEFAMGCESEKIHRIVNYQYSLLRECLSTKYDSDLRKRL
jgi:hypothetical protein